MIKIIDLCKTYRRGRETVAALSNINLEIGAAEFVAVHGPSGAGKTTLLNMIGGLDVPSAGMIEAMGKNLVKSGMVDHRRHTAGFIFADFYLIPTLSAVENVIMPQVWSGAVDLRKGRELMALVGLGHRLRHYPRELSGGEMQRVAIARSLINDPQILLADEPTANLDTSTRDSIIDLFCQLNKERRLTIILATHDQDLVKRTGRYIELDDGKLVR